MRIKHLALLVGLGFCVGAQAQPVVGLAGYGAAATGVVANAFYVSTTGSDSNAGTLAAPFLTLGKAKTAMNASGGTRLTTYIRAGNYSLPTLTNCGGGGATCGFQLDDGTDNNETWSYYPPDGVGSASFSGGSTNTSTGLSTVFYVNGTTGTTINGLTLHDYVNAGIKSEGGTHGLMVKNNTIYNGYGGGAGFFCYGCQTTTIANNTIHDQNGFGINNVHANGVISGFTVTGNVLYNTCTGVDDCGSIYVQDLTASDTSLTISGNYVRDGATHPTLNGGFGSGIYADDCTSNLTISGNVLTGHNGSNTMHIHGGNNITITGNLTDLSTLGQVTAVWQQSDGTGCVANVTSGNSYTNNIIISGGGGGGFSRVDAAGTNPPVISNNAYWNYAGSAVSSGGSYPDSNPTTENPLLTCWSYIIDPSSPVFNAPVSFAGLTAGRGPLGYTLNQSGTVPSSPHTC